MSALKLTEKYEVGNISNNEYEIYLADGGDFIGYFNEVQQMEQIKVINETTFRIENNEVVPYLRIAYFNYQLGY